MKAKLAVLLTVAVFASVAAARAPAMPQAIATGELHWTPDPVCSHPVLDVMLQYYLTDGCGRDLYLSGRVSPQMVGHTVWAEGTLQQNGSCRILHVTSLSVCVLPEPSQ